MVKEKFEDALKKLEKIVSKLEDGEIPSKNPSKLFEEGIRLSRLCNQSWRKRKRESRSLWGQKRYDQTSSVDPSTGSGQAPSDESDSEEDE